jgi:hypothetical protein
MNGDGARWRRAGLLVAAMLALSACAGHLFQSGDDNGDDNGLNAYPANYKSDILAAMHAYLNDPTGIRDAALSAPMLKEVGGRTHYLVCLRFTAKPNNGANAGGKQVAAVFLAGRFDDFVDAPAAKEPCADATYTPFPELENLQP